MFTPLFAIIAASAAVVNFGPAQAGETVLYSFKTSGNDAAEPVAGLIADTQGALYGTTQNGGTSGPGTVFKLAPPASGSGSWTETVLYSFTGAPDGAYPQGELIFDTQGRPLRYRIGRWFFERRYRLQADPASGRTNAMDAEGAL